MRKTIIQLVLIGLLAACSAGPRPGLQATPSDMFTPTFEPEPPQTLECEVTYTVQPGDTLAYIAAAYDVPIEAIRAYNNLGSDVVSEGQDLIIPLCERIGPVYIDPTLTPTIIWNLPAPVLLFPADGTRFFRTSSGPALQWTGVGTLQRDEGYALEIEFAYGVFFRNLSVFLTSTKYIVPTSAFTCDGSRKMFLWRVTPVRVIVDEATGTTSWWPIGEESELWRFDWQCRPAIPTP